MANFYKDNDDIQFLFEHMDTAGVARIMEEDFRFAEEFDFAPENEQDAVDNYGRILESMGEICGDIIAPSAEETDTVGNELKEDGTVQRAPGIAEALKRLGQADMMGFTLPYRFGGLNCPNLVYTMSNDILSRADAALMNVYGLQGIAETINAFASDEIKEEYLPKMASGEWTGAMVLTEPDAGSDLQSVKTRAYQDAEGNWFVHGVKRFITNGCGEVLLVLARTEPEITDGRGLSLLLCEAGPKVKIRRLENKLGIHGSPTCEIFFDDAPAKLIGERQRGLITYVMSLMNGARIGIAAQSLGIGEAAYRVAREYGASRKQFEQTIDNFPAVRELLVKSRVDLQAARALTYFASYSVDLEMGPAKKLEFGNVESADERKKLKQEARKFGRWNKVLTPMAKYYASEMSMRVSNDAIAVLGGSGYMKDYASERHLRDSRITTIYEGTSQLQVVAAIAGVTAGTSRTIIEELLASPTRVDEWPAEVKPLVEQIRTSLDDLTKAVEFVKNQPGNSTRDLYARKLVDIAIYLLVGALFCDYATVSEKRLATAKYWLHWRLPEIHMNVEQILTGDLAVVEEFETLAGPVPIIE
ncbi:MAG: acyl-CoA dehydrogenase family protein [Phycisphaerae bacterium]